jgi:hypothetical protein
MTVRLPVEVTERLRDIAAERNVTMNELITFFLSFCAETNLKVTTVRT